MEHVHRVPGIGEEFIEVEVEGDGNEEASCPFVHHFIADSFLGGGCWLV
jgi:hypothetical protein